MNVKSGREKEGFQEALIYIGSIFSAALSVS